MLRLFIFWGLFTLVLIGIGVTLVRRRRDIRKAAAAKTEAAARAAATARPVVKREEAPFDANATRVHFRPAAPGEPSELPQRDEAMLPATALAKLICVGGTQKGNSFPVTTAGVTVGRDAKNDIVITDPRASNQHAWVGIIGRQAVLRDLGSTNGTFLNAHMDALISEAALSPGDTIFFGGHGGDQFRFVAD